MFQFHAAQRAPAVVTWLLLCVSAFLLATVDGFAIVDDVPSTSVSSSLSALSIVPTCTSRTTTFLLASPLLSEEAHVEKLLFVECGFGADAHGQNPTKAAVRACRNAIEFNQLPALGDLIPGGREGMKLDVLLAVPSKYQDVLELDKVREVFPYGNIRFQIQDGGMVATNGKVIAEMGDKNEDMVVVCCAVSVGY